MGHVTSPRPRILLPGSPPPDDVRVLLPGATDPDPDAQIVVAGQADADPDRRVLSVQDAARTPRDGRVAPPRTIVAARGAGFDAVVRTLRRVGEHRLAASLCRQAGASGGACGGRSIRNLTPATRRGAVAISNDALVDSPREVYTAHNRFSADEEPLSGPIQLPRLDRVHGRNDPMAQRAYNRAGVVLAFYRVVLGRHSFDDRGSTTRLAVHYGAHNDNAAWLGATEGSIPNIMVLGDGDRLSRPQYEGDISYHEFTHGVVDHTANFDYEGQSGALHEHFADALAETAQQWELGQSVEEAPWLFGEGTYRVNAPDGATRSFANPRAYDQPGHVAEARRYAIHEDNGGVHDLAGIPNRAFYLAAQRLGGHTWEHVGVIWYSALRDFLGPRATFRDTANATVRAASELFGARSEEAAAVRAGWAGVGIDVSARGAPVAGAASSTPR